MLRRLIAIFLFSVIFSSAFATQIQVSGIHRGRGSVESVNKELMVKNPIEFPMMNGCLVQSMISFADESYVTVTVTQNDKKLFENYWVPRIEHEFQVICGGQQLDLKIAEKF